jgi:catechol 2,3-dioxygenase-like lactoylglutathione lyase family enzyme
MFRALLAAACLLLCGAAQAQTALGVATIEARLVQDGVRAEVRLSRPVLGFTFEDTDVEREGDFVVLTDGLTLSGNRISGGTPFQRFSVLIRPMAHERDAKYPAFFRVGDGGVLFAPALTANVAEWRTRLHIRAARGQALRPANDARGSVYIGPRAYVTTMRDVILVAAPNTTQALRDAAVAEMRTSLAFYTQRLGVPLRARPVMIIRHEGGGVGFVGDATPAPTMSLRFYGDEWSAPNARSRSDVRRYVAHESFHFWNGGLASHSDGTPSWLHEGGAEYASLLSARAAGELRDEDFLRTLSDALTNCRTNLRFLGDVGLNQLQFLSSGIRYPCGLAIQWMADLGIRAQSGGERDVLDAWGHMIRVAETRENRRYELADFTGYDGMASGAAAIAHLTEESGPERWAALTNALRASGATIEERPSNWTRAQALLMHLSRLSCETGSRGFGVTGTQVTVTADCGALASGPVVTSVEGGHPGDVSAEFYARLQAICARRGDIALVLNGSEQISLPCRTPLPDAESAFVITASPTLN